MVGQALEGNQIEARGVVERTKYEKRLVAGPTRDAKGEGIRFLSLLSKFKQYFVALFTSPPIRF